MTNDPLRVDDRMTFVMARSAVIEAAGEVIRAAGHSS